MLSQLDGEGMRQMEKQQEMASKESYKEHLLKEIAKNTGANIHDSRNDSHQEMRRARVDSAIYFDISHEDGDMGDDMDVTQTNERNAERISCECGCALTRGFLPRHRKSKKHIELMNDKLN